MDGTGFRSSTIDNMNFYLHFPFICIVLPMNEYDCMDSTTTRSLGKKRSTSREQTVLEIGTQMIDDRYGDEPK